jgi:uncharacterized protein
MLRGECPSGGIRVAGYVTAAARHCTISGGQYAVTSGNNTRQEGGTCTFRSGKICAAASTTDTVEAVDRRG